MKIFVLIQSRWGVNICFSSWEVIIKSAQSFKNACMHELFADKKMWISHATMQRLTLIIPLQSQQNNVRVKHCGVMLFFALCTGFHHMG